MTSISCTIFIIIIIIIIIIILHTSLLLKLFLDETLAFLIKVYDYQ